MSKLLPRKFYARNPEVVARELLGKIFVRNLDGIRLEGKIVETEAYLSEGDAASHGFKGKSARNQSLFKEAGHLYIHTMRHHTLLDVVTESKDIPSSVLIRAVEPLIGIEEMKEFRGVEDVTRLASGPGKFCMAFNITKDLDGLDTTNLNTDCTILDADIIPLNSIKVSRRVGIGKAKDFPLRFWIANNPHVSQRNINT